MYQTYRVAAPMLRVLWIYPSQYGIGQRSYGQQGKEDWNRYTNNIYITSNLRNILGLGGGRVGDVNSVDAGPKVADEGGFEDLSCRSNLLRQGSQGPQREFLFLGKLGRKVEGVKVKHCYELIAEMGG